MNTQTKHAESGCTDYLQHTWQSCPENQPQGNKAQHSPLPWHGSDLNPYEVRSGRTHASYNRRIADCREANCVCYTAEDTANARLIVRAVNHADKLAELLTEVYQKLPIGTRDNESLYNRISEALAAWEGAQ